MFRPIRQRRKNSDYLTLYNKPAGSDGKTFFAVFPEKAELSTQNIPSEKLDSIRKVIVKYNQDNQFVVNQSGSQAKSGNENETSWWSDYISNPLKNFLKAHFNAGKQPVAGHSLVGNVTVVAVKLSKKPEANKEMVLNVKFRNGDNSIRLLEGERLTFNSENQHNPAYLLFQCDPKLTRPTQASFKGTSGNIHLAWSITFVILAVMFVIFSLYHRFILPHPRVRPANNSPGSKHAERILQHLQIILPAKRYWSNHRFSDALPCW